MRILLILLAITVANSNAIGCDLNCQNDRLSQAAERDDKLLNETYRKLLAQLPQGDVAELRKVQRDWIHYRDELCDAKEANYCGSSPCMNAQQNVSAANERLLCASELTKKRTKELLSKIDKGPKGLKRTFEFERIR